METIKPVASLPHDQTNEIDDRAGLPGTASADVRALSDYELMFVGGGDGIPGWGH
jgi:hypothetical protein